VIAGQGEVRLITEENRAGVPDAGSVSVMANALFYQQGDGRYAIAAFDGSTLLPLPGANDPNAPLTGLWSESAPLVAYWGYEGNSILSVTNATTGETLMLDSGRSAPITPLIWRPGSAQLIYRDASGFARIADLACLASGCASNPLESGVELLPASASDVVSDGRYAYFRDGNAVKAVDLACAGANTCLNSAITLGTNAATQLPLGLGNGVLIYTGYASNPNDRADREVRAVDLACLSGGSCAPVTVLAGASAGEVSPNGAYVVIEAVGGGLSILNLTNGSTVYLSDAGASLLSARWA
jgi:hypothetical protein